jgi:multiple sugar transport system permease protein
MAGDRSGAAAVRWRARARPERWRGDSAQAGAHVVLAVVSLASVLPFLWMFLGSFKTFNELVRYPPTVIPEQFTLANYREIVFEVNFAQAFLNSLVQATSVTLSTLLTSTLAGYVFAKYRFWGKEQLFAVLLSTMMVPFAVVLVPLYVMIADLKLSNQLGGIIVTGLVSTFGVFLMRQFVEGIPSELIDAGRIDGAAEWWIFSRVIVPLAGAPLAALGVFTYLWNWDSFLWPLVVLSSPENKTLPLVLASLRSLYWARYELWVTGAMLTVAPVMVLYAVAQKQFVRGVALTGLKG